VRKKHDKTMTVLLALFGLIVLYALLATQERAKDNLRAELDHCHDLVIAEAHNHLDQLRVMKGRLDMCLAVAR
jgi:hypothetical protein